MTKPESTATATFRENLLHLIKKFLGNDWSMLPLIQLTFEKETTIVEWVLQNSFDLILFEHLAAVGLDSILRQKARAFQKGVTTGSVEPKQLFDPLC